MSIWLIFLLVDSAHAGPIQDARTALGTAYSAYYDALAKSPKKDSQTIGELSHKFLDGPRKQYTDALQSEITQTAKSSKSPSGKSSPGPIRLSPTPPPAPVEGVAPIDGSQFPTELEFAGKPRPGPSPSTAKKN